MKRYGFLVIFAALAFLAVSMAAAGDPPPPKVFDAPQAVGTKATCPVTGEAFTIAKDTAHSEYKGQHVYFCCPGCKPQFDKNPEKFLAPAKPQAK